MQQLLLIVRPLHENLYQSATDGVTAGVETQCRECFYQWPVAMWCLSQEERRTGDCLRVPTGTNILLGERADWQRNAVQSGPHNGEPYKTKREWKHSKISCREEKWCAEMNRWDKINKSQWVSDGSEDKRENEDGRERRRQVRVGFWLGGCQKAAEKWRPVKRLQESAWAHDNCLLPSWLPPLHLLPTHSTNSLQLLTHTDTSGPDADRQQRAKRCSQSDRAKTSLSGRTESRSRAESKASKEIITIKNWPSWAADTTAKIWDLAQQLNTRAVCRLI